MPCRGDCSDAETSMGPRRVGGCHPDPDESWVTFQ
jgi:hypothetical protein